MTPCGDVFEYINKEETDFIFEEVFGQMVYLQKGIEVFDGATIVDIGANIGLFTLFLTSSLSNLKIVCVEPIKEIFDVLGRNLQSASKRHDITCIRAGVGETERERSDFFYFPSAPGESTRYPAEREEQRKLIGLDQGRTVVQSCGVRSLHRLLGELGVSSVDLLKIDVEGDELGVLLGLGDSISVVRQIVVEVHDINSRLQSIVKLLEANGFIVSTKQQTSSVSSDGEYEMTVPVTLRLFVVYAIRMS